MYLVPSWEQAHVLKNNTFIFEHLYHEPSGRSGFDDFYILKSFEILVENSKLFDFKDLNIRRFNIT